MATKYKFHELNGAPKETFRVIAKRIKDTCHLKLEDEIADNAVYDIGEVPEVGFKFIAKSNARISAALRAARDDKARPVFVDGDRRNILGGDFSFCDLSALVSDGVAFREISYRNFAHLLDNTSRYLPYDKADNIQWGRFNKNFRRLHLDISSLHFTVPVKPMNDDGKPATCDAHIDHSGFFMEGPTPTLEFPNHTINELGIGYFGRAVFGNWFADHFRIPVPAAENLYTNQAGYSLQFRPTDSVTIELYAVNRGVLQDKFKFVDFDRLFSIPTNFGVNIFGSF